MPDVERGVKPEALPAIEDIKKVQHKLQVDKRRLIQAV